MSSFGDFLKEKYGDTSLSISERFEALNEWHKTPDGEKSLNQTLADIKKKFDEEERIVNESHKRYKSMTDDEFTTHLSHLIAQHGEDWRDKCYSEGCEPYPNETLGKMFDVARVKGRTSNKIMDDFDGSFMSENFLYRGYYFNIVHGQGSVMRIFNKKKKKLLHL